MATTKNTTMRNDFRVHISKIIAKVVKEGGHYCNRGLVKADYKAGDVHDDGDVNLVVLFRQLGKLEARTDMKKKNEQAFMKDAKFDYNSLCDESDTSFYQRQTIRLFYKYLLNDVKLPGVEVELPTSLQDLLRQKQIDTAYAPQTKSCAVRSPPRNPKRASSPVRSSPRNLKRARDKD